MPKPSQSPDQTAASLEKALTLFGRIAQDRGSTSLKKLVADLDLPRSTLYRLVATLQDFGFIARGSRGFYDIGLPLVETLNGLQPARHLARLSRPALQELADRCGATAHLGVLENDMVTYLVKVTGKGAAADAVFTRENAQLEAYCSGIGKVLLAALPEMACEQYLAAGPFVALTSRTITDSNKLRDCLQRVREEGFARDDGEVADDLFCLAVPLQRADGAVLAAISVSFQRAERKTREFGQDLENLRVYAAEICKKLGNSTLATGTSVAKPETF
jgi:IclR family acetate operon transcriptional repressor